MSSSLRSFWSIGCRHREVLQKFALHYETGKPIPQELVDKIERSKTFNQGFATVEYLAAAILDMKLHLLGDKKIDARTFEKEALAEIGMPKEIVLRHRLPHFLHVFSSDCVFGGLLQLSLVRRDHRRCVRRIYRRRGATTRRSRSVCGRTSSQSATRSTRRLVTATSADAIRRSRP